MAKHTFRIRKYFRSLTIFSNRSNARETSRSAPPGSCLHESTSDLADDPGSKVAKSRAEYSTITVGRHIEFEASLVRCGWQRVVVVRASELFRSLRHQDEGFAGGGCGVVGVAAAVAVVGSSATTISPSHRGRPLRNPCDTKGPFTLKAPLFKIPRCGMRAELSVVHSG